jgi:hypothetical protein
MIRIKFDELNLSEVSKLKLKSILEIPEYVFYEDNEISFDNIVIFIIDDYLSYYFLKLIKTKIYKLYNIKVFNDFLIFYRNNNYKDLKLNISNNEVLNLKTDISVLNNYSNLKFPIVKNIEKLNTFDNLISGYLDLYITEMVDNI